MTFKPGPIKRFSLEDVLEYIGPSGQVSLDPRDGYTPMRAGVPVATGYKDGDRVESIYLGGPKGDAPYIHHRLPGRRMVASQMPRHRKAIAVRERLDEIRRAVVKGKRNPLAKYKRRNKIKVALG